MDGWMDILIFILTLKFQSRRNYCHFSDYVGCTGCTLDLPCTMGNHIVNYLHSMEYDFSTENLAITTKCLYPK